MCVCVCVCVSVCVWKRHMYIRWVDNLILDFNANNTTLSSPLCSFTHGAHNDVGNVSSRINCELKTISLGWWPANRLLM